jgi:regulator of protease activity HflC (stomatin/prohibitin superfamily)
MFEKLIDVILQFIDNIKPWVVVPVYDRGVRLRWGLNRGLLKPGFHWKIPFADEVLSHMVMTTTINLSEQTITTKDWKSIVVKGVIKYEVDNVEKLMLEVNDPIDAISDMAKGIIRTVFINRDWAECNNDAVASEITKKVKTEAEKWGIDVKKVTLTDLGEMRSFRLFNSTFTQ